MKLRKWFSFAGNFTIIISILLFISYFIHGIFNLIRIYHKTYANATEAFIEKSNSTILFILINSIILIVGISIGLAFNYISKNEESKYGRIHKPIKETINNTYLIYDTLDKDLENLNTLLKEKTIAQDEYNKLVKKAYEKHKKV